MVSSICMPLHLGVVHVKNVAVQILQLEFRVIDTVYGYSSWRSLLASI